MPMRVACPIGGGVLMDWIYDNFEDDDAADFIASLIA
jgi:hypothetical protein